MDSLSPLPSRFSLSPTLFSPKSPFSRSLRSFRPRDDPNDWAVGKNLVFLKTAAYLKLENRLSEHLESSAEVIQAWWRMLVCRFSFRSARRCVILVQVPIERERLKRERERGERRAERERFLALVFAPLNSPISARCLFLAILRSRLSSSLPAFR